eukprot:89682_1
MTAVKDAKVCGKKRSRDEYEEYVDERILHIYIRKLRSLEAQKRELSEKIRARNIAQLNRMIIQQQNVLQRSMAPLNIAINNVLGNVYSEIDGLEKECGTNDGMYCRTCFEFQELVFECRKCKIIICKGCAVRCGGLKCNVLYCEDCNLTLSDFWNEKYGQHLCQSCKNVDLQ